MPDYPVKIITRAEKDVLIYKTTKLPKKYQNEDIYEWKKVGTREALYNIGKQEFVIKVRKAKTVSIGTNQLHATKGLSTDRLSKIQLGLKVQAKRELTTFFKKYIKPVDITQYPIGLRFTFLGNEKRINDLDNHDIYYRKVFLDCIQKEVFSKRGIKVPNPKGFLVEDDIKHVAFLESRAIISKYNALIVEIFTVYEEIDNIKEKYENHVERYISRTKGV